MGPRKRNKKNKEKPGEDPILLSDDSTHSTSSTPRSSNRKRKKTQGPVEDDLTPKKLPRDALTPRKSRRSKDMSPPPLKHRQNRMPEQVIMVNDDSKFFSCITLLNYNVRRCKEA